MRKLILLLVFTFSCCMAQSVGGKPTDPQPKGALFVLDPSSQSPKPLPAEVFKGAHSSIFKTAYGGSPMTGSLEVAGEHSPFRMAVGKPEFVFTFASPENARLFTSTIEKKNRRFAIDAINKDNTMRYFPGVPVDITQFGESSFKLVPKSPLPPGEYAIILEGSPQAKDRRIFTFGIDQ